MSLELTDVRLTYADGDTTLVALDDVSLTVGPGELVAVVGPSGSGKSSLLAVAGTLLRPDSGRVIVGGKDASGLGDGERTALRRERIGLVFQQANLIASLTALEQLLAVEHMRGGVSGEARGRATGLLRAVGLTGREGRRPHQLSGGERQRVNIARALMGDPAVLLVDEPTSALDHARGAEIVKLLAELTGERAVATLLVTHDMAQLGHAIRVTEMDDGRLTERARGALEALP
ncbi:ABC transporter ATP-binding protein [Streptosporangium sp. NPDC051023]|uniref:ABC transporter ATP-binding protein n=1 Tax=Streptosporangium sp. NPDC051023 TaxID=3155410 RepID=UPI00344BFB69